MTTTDPTTGQPLPADAIQRILFVSPKVHVYQIPPLTSNKGHTASTWTDRPAIFEARLRIFETETATTQRSNSKTSTSTSPASSSSSPPAVRIDILLESPTTGELFAGAPYTHPSVVANAIDSSRFFAVRVVGDGGRMKATLGVGFEERSEAFDFGVALQDARRTLGLDAAAAANATGRGSKELRVSDTKRDYSLKDGESIVVDLGGMGKRIGQMSNYDGKAEGGGELFKIDPPPSYPSSGSGQGAVPLLPPPPSAKAVRARLKVEGEEDTVSSESARPFTKQPAQQMPTAEDLGFDDGEFGEFQ